MQGVGVDSTSSYRFVAYDSSGKPFNGAAFVTWVDGSVATYLITPAQNGTSGIYYAADVAGAARWDLWLWSGSLATSYPVDEGDLVAAQITADHGSGLYTAASSGSGAFARTVTVTVDAVPLADVVARMTVGGSIFEATTNASGVASFSLNANTYTLTLSKLGYQDDVISGTVIVAGAGDTAATMSIVGGSVTPSADPLMSNCYTTARTSVGAVIEGYQLRLELLDPNMDADLWRKSVVTATSDGDGLIEVELPRGSKWRAGNETFTVTDTSTFQMPEMIV